MITHHETIPVIGNTRSHLGAKEDVLFFYTDRNAVYRENRTVGAIELFLCDMQWASKRDRLKTAAYLDARASRMRTGHNSREGYLHPNCNRGENILSTRFLTGYRCGNMPWDPVRGLLF